MRSIVVFVSAALCLAGGFARMACAENIDSIDVSLIGLADGIAVVVIEGGKPRMLRAGESRAGVKLISAHNNHAIVEVGGERRTLPLGGSVYSTPRSLAGSTVTLAPTANGHYVTRGSINGASVQFMVDTGASMVSMDAAQARSAGIRYLTGRKGFANTANGLVEVYLVKLDSVQVGNILLTDIDGIVHPNTNLPYVLLGMSFLTRLDMRRENDILTLKQRF